MRNAAELVELGKQVVAEFSDKNVTFMAASIAYNALVSLAPLLILLVLVVSLVGGGLEARLLAAASTSLPGPIADVVARIFSGQTSATVSIIGLTILLWGTLKIFRSLDTAFSEIYETDNDSSIAAKLGDAFVVLVALGASIFATIGVTTLFARASAEIPVLGLMTPLVLLGGLIVAFFPMYYRFPDTDLGWRDVLPGTLLAALGWAALQGIFQIYLLFRGGGGGSYLSGVLVIVTWLYFSGLVLLLGAVLNAVLGGYPSDGSGEVSAEVMREDSGVCTRTVLTGEEAANCLENLQNQLRRSTGTSAEERGPPKAAGHLHDEQANQELVRLLGTVRPSLSDDEVEVIEWSHSDEDERLRRITFRWSSPIHDSMNGTKPE